MLRSRYRFVIGMLPVLVFAMGCQATGLGFIPSADLNPTDKATFGFIYDGPSLSFSGSYHDKTGVIGISQVDVAFKGTGITRKCSSVEPCGAPGKFPWAVLLIGIANYVPQDQTLQPACAATATNPNPCVVQFTFFDLDGNGAVNMGDFVTIDVLSGPYAGYHNEGVPSGNLTVS